MSIPTEFFNWEVLGTLMGAATAVFLIVQFSKDYLPAMIPVRLWAWFWGWLVLTLAALATGKFTWPLAALNILNAAVVALTAMGEYALVSSAGLAKSQMLK